MESFYVIEIYNKKDKLLGYLSKEYSNITIFTKTKDINEAMRFYQENYTQKLITFFNSKIDEDLNFKTFKYNIASIRKMKINNINKIDL